MWRPGWRWKAATQHLLSVVPGGDRGNYILQRHITHSYPVADASLEDDRELGHHHAEVFRQHRFGDLSDARLFEFGAGWDLAMPLIMRALGARHQLVVDLRPLARPELVADIAHRIGLDEVSMRTREDLSAFLTRHGIEYRAPCDARATNEPSSSIDLITSTNTLEHIPAEQIETILRECHRILAPSGVMSFQIDYKDHYSYFDRRLSPYAFLRHSPQRWRLHNPSLHHQNRLRHPDYVALMGAAGFDVLEAHVVEGSASDVEAVEALPPHPCFQNRSARELAIRESRMVLVKSRDR